MKELLDAINVRFQQQGVYDVLNSVTTGDVIERRKRPYAQIDGLAESLGTKGVKRTNKGEYRGVLFQVTTVGDETVVDEFEDLSGRLVPLVVNALVYAPLRLVGAKLVIIEHKVTRYFETDYFWQAVSEFEAGITKDVNFNPS